MTIGWTIWVGSRTAPLPAPPRAGTPPAKWRVLTPPGAPRAPPPREGTR